MMRTTLLCLLAMLATIVSTSAFGNTEDKFIKKYAMMKIYESCFGQDVVKQIRKDMKAACAKCASYELPPSPPPAPTPTRHSTVPPSYDKKGDITDPENTLYANQQTFDSEKLHQALLAYRPNPFSVPTYRPYQQPFYNGYTSPGFSGPLYYPGSFPQAFGSPYNYPMFAQQYMGSSRVSQCVPEIKREKSPLSRELVRPMFFFKCYKHKKLEACIMKDVREKYAGVNEDDFDGEVEFRRTGSPPNSKTKILTV